jgi:hypothetical protein
MLRSNSTEGAECWDASTLADKPVPCLASKNDYLAGKNCRNRASMAGAGGIALWSGIGGSDSWCRACTTRHAHAGHDDLDVLGTGSACMCACACENASTVRRACFRGRSDSSAGTCSKKLSRGVEVGGASCRFACPCAVVAGTTSTTGGRSSIGGNVGTTCGGV